MVFCVAIFIDGSGRYRSKIIRAVLEYEPSSISNCTPARLKLILATATIRINIVINKYHSIKRFWRGICPYDDHFQSSSGNVHSSYNMMYCDHNTIGCE